MKFSLLVLTLTLGSLAQAEKPKELPQCASIAKACEAAGYHAGDHKKTGKGLWVDCVGAIAHGKTVEGVTATQEEAKACADAAKVERKEHKANKK
jgi:hypothetical protein